jgi:hypothetical protein
MVVKRRLGVLLAGTVVGASFLATAPAFADDAQLQQQINAMQQQLSAMQAQMAQVKKNAAAQAQQQQAAAQNTQNIPPNLYNADLPVPTKGPPSWFDTIHISMAGSFIAMEGVWRAHNENASGASDPPFGTLPFQNSPLYYENELRFSAQQSRIALKASGDIDPAQHLKAYYESDFLGAGVTANSRESNSYNLRIRQAYLEYDNDNWGFHLVGGQSWSLLTQNRVGMLPSTENIPLTIDAQYVTGFNWARQPEIRFVEDWNKTVWFGVSVASSQTAFASNGNGVAGAVATSAGAGTVLPPGINANVTNNCNAGGLLDSVTQCSINPAPDIIEKIAIDPGWGHYEALGLQRWFADATNNGLAGAQWSQRTSFGWGVGGNALLPVWPKFVDLQGSVLYGQGIGRYGSGQLTDVVVGPTGNLQPLTEVEFMVGGVAHPWAGSDWYAYYGQEQEQAKAWTIGATAGGFGNAAFPEVCGIETAATLASTNGAGFIGSGCTGNVQRVREITAGFWQDFYKGDLGRMRYGLEYEYVMLDLFSGATTGIGANTGLHPSNNIVFISLRYYPFN